MGHDLISGTLSYGGSWAPTITVTDGTYTNTDSFNWTVSSPILITDPGDQANTIGDTVSLTILAVDNASGTLSFSASGLPSGLSINSSTGVISGTVGGGASTTTPYTPTITVTDGTRTAVDSFNWTITQAGPVIVTYPGNQTNAVGDMLALPIEATDTANNPLIYSVSGLPTGLYLNPTTGLLFGTIPSGATSGSPYSVTVTAKDSASNTASQSFTWTINSAGTLILANPGDQTNTEGDSVSVAVTDTYTGGGTVHYVAIGLPAGLSISASSGTISGTLAVGDGFESPYTVTVIANDGTYSATQSFNWTVNDPITITAPLDQTNNEGDSPSLSISASGGGTLSYAALGLPAGLKINASTGAITGTVAVGAAANGPYSVTILVGDGTSSATQSFNWTINSPITITTPDDQTNNDGDSVSLSISASGSGTLVYSALDLPPGLSINPSTGAISGTVALGDSSFGSFEPTIVVSNGTYASSTSFEWDINGAITISDPGDQANVVGDTVSLQLVADDTGAGTMSYAAWGLPAGLSLNTSTGLISGTVGSGGTAIGTYTTTVTVSDGTNVATDTFDWTISAAGTITLTTPSNQTTAEGSSGSLSLSASGGGTKHYFAVGLPPGLVINPSSGAISGTVAIDEAAYGPYNVTVLATDGTNVAVEMFTWTVTDPVTISTVADQATSEGTTISTLPISASDSSAGTLKYTAIGLPSGLVINASSGAITGTIGLGATAYGPYSATVVAGDGTYSAAITFNWTIDDPITITQPVDQVNVEGDSVSLSISASGGGTLNYSAFGLPAGLKINTVTGAIAGTVAVGTEYLGSYNVTITASDNMYSASQTFAMTVGSPITLIGPESQTFSAGQSVSVQLSASGSGSLTYTAINLPWGLFLNSSTGIISGAIPAVTSAVGGTEATLFVSNGTNILDTNVEFVVTNPSDGLATAFDRPSQPADMESNSLVSTEAKQKVPDLELNQEILTGGAVVGIYGQFLWPIGFHLKTAASTTGWIIQEVTITRRAIKVKNGKETDVSEQVFGKGQTSQHYWEAWEVQKGELSPPGFLSAKYQDQVNAISEQIKFFAAQMPTVGLNGTIDPVARTRNVAKDVAAYKWEKTNDMFGWDYGQFNRAKEVKDSSLYTGATIITTSKVFFVANPVLVQPDLEESRRRVSV